MVMTCRIYEQCRFGRHLPFAKDSLKDGFLRVPTRLPVTNPNDFLKQVERHINNGASLIAKLNVRNFSRRKFFASFVWLYPLIVFNKRK